MYNFLFIRRLINEHMALFKYFKRTSKCTEGHRETLSANDINKANESIAKALEVKGRGKYNTIDSRD